MGRRHSPEHFQSVIDMWRHRLLSVSWGRPHASADLKLLAATIRSTCDEGDSAQRKRWLAAVRALRAALVASADAAARPDTLDEWIERSLVRADEDRLLITDQARRAALAQARDAHRRRVRAGQEIRSARIEMPADAWATLEAVRTRLQAHGQRKLSLGAALEKIIIAYNAASALPVIRKRPGRTRQETSREDDLFSCAGPGKSSY